MTDYDRKMEDTSPDACKGSSYDKNDNGRRGCCRRFANEVPLGMFALEEEPFGKLDMERNFRIGTGIFSLVGGLKLIFLGLSVASLAVDISNAIYPSYYMAYLTSWSLIYCIVYQIGSLLLTVLPYPYDPSKTNILLKLTWISFSLVAVHQVCVFFLFWGTVYSPGYSVDFGVVMPHGGVMILCIIDGLVINRTPIRLKHVVLNMVMCALYAVWSVLQNTVIQYNPYGDEDDDAIYSIMKWREGTGLAVGVFLGLLLVVIPVLQVLFWAVSLPGRFYLPPSAESPVAAEMSA